MNDQFFVYRSNVLYQLIFIMNVYLHSIGFWLIFFDLCKQSMEWIIWLGQMSYRGRRGFLKKTFTY